MAAPLDSFGDIVCVVMPVMLSFEEINKIQREHDCDLFPYVGLVSENKKVLGDMFADFRPWFEAEQKRREKAATLRANDKKEPGDWMSIFDAGEQAIQKTLGGAPAPTPNPKGKK